MNKVFKYEELETCLDELTQVLNLPERIELPNAKGGVRKDKRPVKEVYSEQDSQLIAEHFAREIYKFNYSFG